MASIFWSTTLPTMRPCLGMSCGSGQDLLDNFMLGQHDALVLCAIPDVQESYTLREHLVNIIGFIKYDLSLAALGINTDHRQDRTRLLVECCICHAPDQPGIPGQPRGACFSLKVIVDSLRREGGGPKLASGTCILQCAPSYRKPFGNRPLTFLSLMATAVAWWQLGKFLILAECIKHIYPSLVLLLTCMLIRKVALGRHWARVESLQIEEWTCHHPQTAEASPQALMEDGTHKQKSWWHIDSWPWPIALLYWCCLLQSSFLMHNMTNQRDGNKQAC